MLLLSRKVHETIVINDNIEVVVLGVSGNTVRLGITAPEAIPVHRKEIHSKIQKERKMFDMSSKSI